MVDLSVRANITRVSAVVVLGAAVLLGACSNREPSAADIVSALEREMSSELEQMRRVSSGLMGSYGTNPMGGLMNFKISNLEKIGCTENGKTAYRCNVNFEVSGGILGSTRQTRSGAVELLRASSGWTVSSF